MSGILNLQSLKISPTFVERGADTWISWKTLTAPQSGFKEVNIALVGKYTTSLDAYLSLIKSLEHAAMACRKKLNLMSINASHLDSASTVTNEERETAWRQIHNAQGILVPGGFGARGIEGMIEAIKYARENGVPFLGICLGMQMAVIEFARHVCDLTDANSVEMDKDTPHPVIINMPELDHLRLGGTMRLGVRPTIFQKGSGDWSKIRAVYASASSQLSTDVNGAPGAPEFVVQERHRHRYEVNPSYIEALHKNGLEFVGKDDKGERSE